MTMVRWMLWLPVAAMCLATCRALSTKDPNVIDGRSAIVHLFEWRWDDIAEECERFLGPRGFAGVQTSPANENGVIWEPHWNRNVRRPWYERYQPVSYKLQTRSGNENQFRDMVRRCNKAGVRIYVDAILNHMTGDIGHSSTGGSSFDYHQLKYDGVPYSALDFNGRDKCPSGSGSIEDYQNVIQVRNCWLQGLSDLDQGKEYVRNKIAEYLNKLIDIGVAGFRIDAAKHMWPGDLQAIYNRLHNLNGEFFPANSRPFIFQEVIDLANEPVKAEQYTHLGRILEFKYGRDLGNVIRKNYGQKLKYLKNFGEGWGHLPGTDVVTFIDNHDNQRGHGAGGFGTILTFFEPRMYKMAVGFMLAWPYGFPRIMSSFSWPRDIQGGSDRNDWIGPPSDGNWNIKRVAINSDNTCGNGWVCEHRWRQIYNMVQFRNVAGFGQVANWWDNGDNAIAFSRGNKAFFAMNNDHYAVNQRLQTGLPAGRYCDVISGSKDNGRCTGRTVDVGGDGYAQIYVDNSWEDPMIAIHVQSKL